MRPLSCWPPKAAKEAAPAAATVPPLRVFSRRVLVGGMRVSLPNHRAESGDRADRGEQRGRVSVAWVMALGRLSGRATFTGGVATAAGPQRRSRDRFVAGAEAACPFCLKAETYEAKLPY